MRYIMWLCGMLLWAAPALAQNEAATVICKTVITGKVTVDSISFSTPLPIMEGDDCARSLAIIIQHGFEFTSTIHQVGLNRVEYTLSTAPGGQSNQSKLARVALLVCNTTVTGRVTVDGFATSDPSIVVPEQAECAGGIATINAAGLGNQFSSLLAAPERTIFAYTDVSQFPQPHANIAIITCNANTTGTFVVDGFSLHVTPPPLIEEQQPCAAATALLANLGLTNIFSQHSISNARVMYAFTDHQ